MGADDFGPALTVSVQATGSVGRITSRGVVDAIVVAGTSTRAPFAGVTTAAGKALSGTIVASTIGQTSIGGNCSADIDVSSVPVGVSLNIDGSLTGDLVIGTLSGQINVNRGVGAGTWQSPATATVGPVQLSPIPYYDICSMMLGYGAIGLVPFHLYDNDCMPPNRLPPALAAAFGRSNFFFRGDAAHVRFYGPVTTSDGFAASGVKIERFNEITSAWADVTASFTLDFQAPAPGFNRAVRIRDNSAAADPDNGLFRLVPRTTAQGANLLLCAVGTAVLPPVAAFDYRFRIEADCYNPSVVSIRTAPSIQTICRTISIVTLRLHRAPSLITIATIR